MRIHCFIIAAALLANLVGCGGSSGESGGTSAGVGVTTPAVVAGLQLGSRNVPGGTVTVSTAGPLQPGLANVFRLTLNSDMPTPSAITAWIGIAYDSAATGIPATPIASGPGSYAATILVPSPLATGSHVWVRLSFADGSVVETGSEDFMLASH